MIDSEVRRNVFRRVDDFAGAQENSRQDEKKKRTERTPEVSICHRPQLRARDINNADHDSVIVLSAAKLVVILSLSMILCATSSALKPSSIETGGCVLLRIDCAKRSSSMPMA